MISYQNKHTLFFKFLIGENLATKSTTSSTESIFEHEDCYEYGVPCELLDVVDELRTRDAKEFSSDELKKPQSTLSSILTMITGKHDVKYLLARLKKFLSERQRIFPQCAVNELRRNGEYYIN